jgi:hypothetical protein
MRDKPAVVCVRDIAFSDAPRTRPVAQTNMTVDVAPDAHIGFRVTVPDSALNDKDMALNLEVHIDLDGSGTFSRGDLVSLKAQPIGANTPGTPLVVPLDVV